jgi:3-oxoacyl-[acyl-carrier protein] reductase
MEISLKGRVVLVTGAARGIGKSIARTLGKSGGTVVISDIDSAALSLTEKEFSSEGIETSSQVCDVANSKQVAEMVASIEKKYGKLDILVNNAGITRDSLLVRAREEDWDLVYGVNLKGTMNCTKQVARGMMKQQWGRIINIASVVGQIGNTGQAIYSATKAGIIGFTKTMARELAARNITVNAIAPGYIQTEMTDALPADVKDAFMKQIPLKKFGTVDDVAFATLILSSEGASYITGQVLGVNGGLAMV